MDSGAVPTDGGPSIDRRLQLVIEMLGKVGVEVESARQEISESHDKEEPGMSSLEDLIEESRLLRQDVEQKMADNRRRVLAQTVLSTVLVLCVAVLLFQARQNVNLIRQVNDCTNLTGSCYQERVRASRTVELVVESQIAVRECGETAKNNDEFEKCVMDRLQKAREEGGH